MILISWTRFRWELAEGKSHSSKVPAPFVIRKAEKDEESTVQKTVSSAFSIDGSWADAWKSLESTVTQSVTDCFEKNPEDCLVIIHGTRIIGASVLSCDADADNHLLTGPCILHEYRSRGLGTLLLAASLQHLKDNGLSHAYGLTRDRTVAARFVYPKFGGIGMAYADGPQIATKITV